MYTTVCTVLYWLYPRRRRSWNAGIVDWSKKGVSKVDFYEDTIKKFLLNEGYEDEEGWVGKGKED